MPRFGIVIEDNSLGLNVMQAFHECAYFFRFIFLFCNAYMICNAEKEMFHDYLNLLSFTSANLKSIPFLPICLHMFYPSICENYTCFLRQGIWKKLINMPIWIFVKETMTIAANPSQLNSYPQFIPMLCNF